MSVVFAERPHTVQTQQTQPKRGQVFMADLGEISKNKNLQSGIRPVIIVSNDRCNKASPNVSIVPLTSSLTKAKLPTHIPIEHKKYNLDKDSIAQAESTTCISKDDLKYYITTLDESIMYQVGQGIKIQYSLFDM